MNELSLIQNLLEATPSDISHSVQFIDVLSDEGVAIPDQETDAYQAIESFIANSFSVLGPAMRAANNSGFLPRALYALFVTLKDSPFSDVLNGQEAGFSDLAKYLVKSAAIKDLMGSTGSEDERAILGYKFIQTLAKMGLWTVIRGREKVGVDQPGGVKIDNINVLDFVNALVRMGLPDKLTVPSSVEAVEGEVKCPRCGFSGKEVEFQLENDFVNKYNCPNCGNRFELVKSVESCNIKIESFTSDASEVFLTKDDRPVDYGAVNMLLIYKYGKEKGERYYEEISRETQKFDGGKRLFVVGRQIVQEIKMMLTAIGAYKGGNDLWDLVHKNLGDAPKGYDELKQRYLGVIANKEIVKGKVWDEEKGEWIAVETQKVYVMSVSDFMKWYDKKIESDAEAVISDEVNDILADFDGSDGKDSVEEIYSNLPYDVKERISMLVSDLKESVIDEGYENVVSDYLELYNIPGWVYYWAYGQLHVVPNWIEEIITTLKQALGNVIDKLPEIIPDLKMKEDVLGVGTQPGHTKGDTERAASLAKTTALCQKKYPTDSSMRQRCIMTGGKV